MHRNFLRGLLITLVPCVLLGAFAIFGTYRPGIDLAGGTILVYELDLAKLNKNKSDPDAGEREGLDSDQMQQLAESLKRRIDPVDTKNIIIRPVGNSRVEIILPFTPKKGGGAESAVTEDDVQFVKDIVGQVGVLEFRILANLVDDLDGIRDAEARIAAMTAEESDRLARAGAEPPPPSGEYTVRVNDVDVSGVRYEWKELGREERESLRLSNKYGENPEPGSLFAQLAARRGQTYRYEISGSDEGRVKNSSMLLYSREFKNENPKPDEKNKKVEYFVLTRVSPADNMKVGGEITLNARADTDSSSRWVVVFFLNSAGASQFGSMTERNRPTNTTYRNLAILLDDRVVSAPTLNSRIDGVGQISGNFTKNSVDKLVYILRSGALTAELKPNPVSENTVGPTLGLDTRTKGLYSIAFAFIAVLAFMIYYYRFAGLVACLALLVNLLLTVGFMNAVSAAYTLAGLAGIVLMLGMAVDANVLIYERVREERGKGANLPTAIRIGYERALPTILDTHLTSIFTAVVLYTFGNDNLKGFAVSLSVGLAISLFTALYVTRLIFDYWIHRRWLKELRMLSLFSRPNIDFMSIRKPVFLAMIGFTLLGLGLFLFRGEQMLNVDFRGGTAYGGRLSEPLALDQFQKLLSENNQKTKLVVQDIVPIRQQIGDDPDNLRSVSTRIFNIQYAGAPRPVTVTLASDPAGPGAAEEAQIAALKQRASRLPDASIEQVFIRELDSDLPSGASKSFTVRTTESEADLVQAMLDRLLRGPDDQPLIAATQMTVAPVQGPTVELTFSAPTSLNYMIGLFRREFLIENCEPAVGKAFVLTGVAEGTDEERAQQARSGKYQKMMIDVSKNPLFKSLAETDQAKAQADRELLQKILNKATLTFESRPTPDRLETFDSTLAADTKARAAYAILASWVAILLYLWFRFGSWTFGLSAVICLIHDLCFTLGIIALCHYLQVIPGVSSILLIQDFKIDLAAVAALLTLVGFSVNDTIVVFDRIREVRGKNPLLTVKMINDSINQTLSRTVLSSLTVFLVVIVLYIFGGEGVHLFAFVMVVGVIVGTISSIYVASPMLLFLGEGQPKAEPSKDKELVGV